MLRKNSETGLFRAQISVWYASGFLVNLEQTFPDIEGLEEVICETIKTYGIAGEVGFIDPIGIEEILIGGYNALYYRPRILRVSKVFMEQGHRE
jgi:hypothetical protein